MKSFTCFEDLAVAAFIWCDREGAVALAADDPVTRSIGYSCFVPGTDPEESQRFWVSLSEMEPLSCDFLKSVVVDPHHSGSAAGRMQLAPYFCNPEKRARFASHLNGCQSCLPRYVMGL